MTGLVVLAIAVPLLLAYLWLARAAVRYAKRKTGSNLVVTFVVVGFFVVTFGDTVFNRWYHKEVLCKREDVGVRIIEKIQLPVDFMDQKTQRPNFPLPLDQPFFKQFSTAELRTSSGFFPLTAHGRKERTIVNNQSGKVLARFVDYYPLGGSWWLVPIDWFGEDTLIGWLNSRQRRPSCFGGATIDSLSTISSYFRMTYQEEEK